MTPDMTGPIEIAFAELKLGAITLQGGDRFDGSRHLSSGALQERHIDVLRAQAKIKPLTPENYAIWVARNGDNWVGRGFTRAELVERGIISTDAPKAAPKPAADKPKAERLPSGDPVDYKGHFIQAFKYSRFTVFEVYNSDLELLREKAFKSLVNAEKFIDELVDAKAGASTPPPADDTTAETKQESDDVVHIQPGSI